MFWKWPISIIGKMLIIGRPLINCLSEYSLSRPFLHFVCIWSFRHTRSSKCNLLVCFGALRRGARTHTHIYTHARTLQPGEQRLSSGLCFQHFIIKHVPQFSNSKDAILQQSPIELILTLSLDFREECAPLWRERRYTVIMFRSQNLIFFFISSHRRKV